LYGGVVQALSKSNPTLEGSSNNKWPITTRIHLGKVGAKALKYPSSQHLWVAIQTQRKQAPRSKPWQAALNLGFKNK
jgi:hypothetical protein